MIKRPIITILLLFIIIDTYSQVLNLNPDPDGDPWYAGSLRELSANDSAWLESLTVYSYSDIMAVRDLPASLDNSENEWFRTIFNQQGGSCGQASGVGYNFTYEIDYVRGIPANTTDNQYPTHYTWNFLNGGNGGGSWYFDGWQIIDANGCPNITDYGGGIATGGPTRWMSGYDSYYNGMHNRMLEVFSIPVGTEEGLETLKQWMHNHLDGSDAGGLANFAAGVSNSFVLTSLPSGTPEAGKAVITWWDEQVNHALTFVGYNDSIKYDFNNDGLYTKDIDINGDDIIDLKDCEIGGLIVANSWGTGWGNDGKAYMMYKLLAEPTDNGGIWGNQVHVIRCRENYEPIIVAKALIKHTSRNKLRITAGISSDNQASEPEEVLTFPLFNYQGGDYYMQGGYNEEDKTIEIGLDITPLLSYAVNGTDNTFFLRIVEQDADGLADGEVISWSLMDYTDGTQEIACLQNNVPIVNDGITLVPVVHNISFEAPEIQDNALPPATAGNYYEYQMQATGGLAPYQWDILIEYTEETFNAQYPAFESEQLIPNNNDDGFVEKELDFSFPFYGESFDKVYLLTDGSLTFSSSFEYIRNESNLLNNKAITPYGADLMIYPEQDDAIWYEGNEDYASFRWKTSKYNDPAADVDMGLKIYPGGKIEFFYNDDITPTTDWVSGISNGDGESFAIADLSSSYSIPQDYATSFIAPEFPFGMELSDDGLFYGTPEEAGEEWNILFKVTDFMKISSLKEITFSSLNVGYEEKTADNSFKVYPNPAKDKAIIMLKLDKASNIEINIFRPDGSLAMESIRKNIPEGQHSIAVNTSAMDNGVYLCQIIKDNKQLVSRLIIWK